MDTRPAAAPEHRPGQVPRGIMQRLLEGLRGRAAPRQLAPPGHRSGAGAGSVAPYLEQGRGTRPSPLE